ncbi:hypothetical protein C8J56DRAFT_1165433 [Mycena floridula]|nr:hypothetical protein C8J56DRAFT_1165433 [Mycena floridula]
MQPGAMDPYFSSFSKASGPAKSSRLAPRSARRQSTPYSRHSSMLPMLPEVLESEHLLDQLTTFNMAGIVSHYSREEKAFVEWDRGNFGLAKLQNAIDQGLLGTPHCGHAADPHISLQHTVMKVHSKSRQDPNQSYTGYLKATNHACKFIAYIPSLNIKKREGSTDVEDDGIVEEDEVLALVLQRSRDDVSHGSSSSISSFSSGTSSPIALSSPPSSPGPQDPKKTQSVVEAEAEQCQIERAITSSIELAYDDKIYMYNPDVHPGFQSDVLALTPAVLRPYHPQTTGAPIPDMDDVYRTHSGIGVAHFNSTIGLKMQNFRLLKTQSIHCRICDNYFSVYGFQMHTVTGDDGIKYCSHHVERIAISNVQALVAAVPRMKFRRYPLGVVPPNPVYAFNDAIARAWLSWNSRHGVSSHTWALISTSDQFCTRCQLSRSFAGHRIHLNVVGECRDPGEGGAPSGSDSDSDECYDN